MNGPEAPGPEESAQQVDLSGDAECVITTVVDGSEIDDLNVAPRPVTTQPAAGEETVLARLTAVEAKLAPAEGATEAVTNLHQAVAEEFQRHVNALAGHDQTLVEFGQALVDLLGRVETLDARGSTGPAAVTPALGPGDVDRRVADLEARLEAMAQLPVVVRALRMTVRADEEILAAEVAARERAEAANRGAASAEALDQVAGRLVSAEARLSTLSGLPNDVATLSRIVRRELDAVTADVQAREQVLRRALQKEIERLQEASAEREEAVEAVAPRLALLERGLRNMDQAQEDAAALVTHRIEEIEARLGSVDGLADDVDTLRSGMRRELERLRASSQTQDQAAAEAAKRFVAIEDRLARLDALPGEVQAQRSAIRTDAERTIVTLRSIEERTAEGAARTTRQLRQLADAVTEVNQRGAALASELGATRATMRTMEIALAEAGERLDTLDRRLSPPAPFPGGTAPPG